MSCNKCKNGYIKDSNDPLGMIQCPDCLNNDHFVTIPQKLGHENEKKLEDHLLILETITGSHLYGTPIDGSDVDFLGIFVSNQEHLLGLKIIKELDLSQKENNIDRKIYELKEWTRNTLKCNPKFFEMLFVPPFQIVTINQYGYEILHNRELFISRKVIEPFLGYAIGSFEKFKKDNTNTKSAYTSYRLLYQLLQLLRNGEIEFPLDISDDLISLRNGEFIVEELEHELESMINTVRQYELITQLPKTPKYKEVEDLIINIHRDYLR